MLKNLLISECHVRDVPVKDLSSLQKEISNLILEKFQVCQAQPELQTELPDNEGSQSGVRNT